MARICLNDFNDFDPSWLRTFGRFTIPESQLDKWLLRRRATGEDDPLRRKIESVLRAAGRIAAHAPSMKKHAIAKLLVNEGRAEGYDLQTVRKILAGRYQPQRDRDIAGLTGWMRQHP